jgi:hypothetical protein
MYSGISAVDRQQQPLRVSAMQLIANSEEFGGKFVSVIGFLSLSWEGDLLYSHKEDYDHVIQANALWLDRTNQNYQDRETL